MSLRSRGATVTDFLVFTFFMIVVLITEKIYGEKHDGWEQEL